MTIVEVNSKWKLKQFIDFPYALYSENQYWVPPLRMDENALLSESHPIWKGKKRKGFLAIENGKIQGRIMAIIQPSGIGSFGFLEVKKDNNEAFNELMKSVETWLQSNGCQEIIGPLNPDINNTMGLLIDGFGQRPTIMMTYNNKEIPEMIEKYGFSVDRTFSSYELTPEKFIDYEKLQRVKSWLEKKHKVSVRNPNMRDFNRELEIFHKIYNSAFKMHYGTCELEWETFKLMGKGMKLIINPELVFVIEKDKSPVGFLLALPDYNEVFAKMKGGRLFPFGWFHVLINRRNIERVRIMTMAIDPKFQHLGLGSLVYSLMSKSIDDCNYKYAELGWVDDENIKMAKACKLMGGKVSKRYAVFKKTLNDE